MQHLTAQLVLLFLVSLLLFVSSESSIKDDTFPGFADNNGNNGFANPQSPSQQVNPPNYDQSYYSPPPYSDLLHSSPPQIPTMPSPQLPQYPLVNSPNNAYNPYPGSPNYYPNGGNAMQPFGQANNNNGAFGQQQQGLNGVNDSPYGTDGQYGEYGSGFSIRGNLHEIVLVFICVLFVFWA